MRLLAHNRAVVAAASAVAVLSAATVAPLAVAGTVPPTAGADVVEAASAPQVPSLDDALQTIERRERAAAAAERKAARERREAKAEARRERVREQRREAAAQRSARAAQRAAVDPRSLAAAMAAERYGWGADQFQCLDSLWVKESNWNHTAQNPSSGAYGIPQSLPGDKMSSHGPDWQTNPATQISWGLDYISQVYGTPCGAWAHSQSVGWY